VVSIFKVRESQIAQREICLYYFSS